MVVIEKKLLISVMVVIEISIYIMVNYISLAKGANVVISGLFHLERLPFLIYLPRRTHVLYQIQNTPYPGKRHFILNLNKLLEVQMEHIQLSFTRQM